MARDDVELWFAEAKNDFSMGEILRGAEKFNGAVFHYQQAVEKAVKALLYLINEQPWGHSILKLLEQYDTEAHPVAEQFKSDAREVDRHYITSRYPDALPDLAPKDAYDAEITSGVQKKTEDLLTFVETEIERILREMGEEEEDVDTLNDDNEPEEGEDDIDS